METRLELTHPGLEVQTGKDGYSRGIHIAGPCDAAHQVVYGMRSVLQVRSVTGCTEGENLVVYAEADRLLVGGVVHNEAIRQNPTG